MNNIVDPLFEVFGRLVASDKSFITNVVNFARTCRAANKKYNQIMTACTFVTDFSKFSLIFGCIQHGIELIDKRSTWRNCKLHQCNLHIRVWLHGNLEGYYRITCTFGSDLMIEGDYGDDRCLIIYKMRSTFDDTTPSLVEIIRDVLTVGYYHWMVESTQCTHYYTNDKFYTRISRKIILGNSSDFDRLTNCIEQFIRPLHILINKI